MYLLKFGLYLLVCINDRGHCVLYMLHFINYSTFSWRMSV